MNVRRGLWLQELMEKRKSGTKVELLAQGKWLMSAKYTCQWKIYKPKVALLRDDVGQQQLQMKSMKWPFGIDLPLKEWQTGVGIPSFFLFSPSLHPQVLGQPSPTLTSTETHFWLLLCPSLSFVRAESWKHTNPWSNIPSAPAPAALKCDLCREEDGGCLSPRVQSWAANCLSWLCPPD